MAKEFQANILVQVGIEAGSLEKAQERAQEVADWIVMSFRNFVMALVAHAK